MVLSVGPIFFSLAKIDTDIIEAARDMGATAFQIFREIILPLSLPGVAIGMIFIFVMLMGEFATAVVVFGGKTSTVGTVILNYYAIANYPFAAVNAIMLMLAMMIGVVIILRLGEYSKGIVIMARWSKQKRKKALGTTLFSGYYGLFLIFIYGPMIAMFILSFQGRRGGTSFPMRGSSFYWWQKLVEPSVVGDMQGALLRSLILALIVMVITALFSTMLAMAFRKRFFRIKCSFLYCDVRLDGARYSFKSRPSDLNARGRHTGSVVVFRPWCSCCMDTAIWVLGDDGCVQSI